MCMCVYSSIKVALSHNYLYISSPYSKYNSSLKARLKIINTSGNNLFLQIYLRNLKLFKKIFRKINIRH